MSDQVKLKDGTQIDQKVVDGVMDVLSYLEDQREYGVLTVIHQLSDSAQDKINGLGVSSEIMQKLQDLGLAAWVEDPCDQPYHKLVFVEGVAAVARNAIQADEKQPFLTKVKSPVKSPATGVEDAEVHPLVAPEPGHSAER